MAQIRAFEGASNVTMGGLTINNGSQTRHTTNNFGNLQQSYGGPNSAPATMTQNGPGWNWGYMQQSNGGPSGTPTTTNQSGMGSNVGTPSQYPPNGWPGTPGAHPSPQPAFPVQQDWDPHFDPSLRPPNPDARKKRAGRPSRPGIRPPQVSPPTPSPTGSGYSTLPFEQEGNEEDECEDFQEALVQERRRVASAPSGPLPQLRHIVLLANGAKAALENAMPTVQRLFSKAGLKNGEWIAQVGFNDQELFAGNRYEEIIQFIILHASISVNSINRKKLKSLFGKFRVVIRSHTGEDIYLEKGSGKARTRNITPHQRETDLMANLAPHPAPVSRELPRRPDCARIAFTTETALSGPIDSQAKLVVEANIAHKQSDPENDGDSRTIEFKKLDFRMSGQPHSFLLRFAHVSIMSGEANIDVKQPEQKAHRENIYKETTAKKTSKSSTKTVGATADTTGKLAVSVGGSWTTGSDVQKSSEQTFNHLSVDWQYLDAGIKVKYQHAQNEALQPQFLIADRRLPIFSVTKKSSASSADSPGHNDVVKIRLTSFWTYKVSMGEILEPKKLGFTKRIWRRIMSSIGSKESNPRVAPGFTNFVHCVDLEVSTEFLGMVKDWKLASSPLDLSIDSPEHETEAE